MKRFKKKIYKLKEMSLNNDEMISFYQMLLKFEKRHPSFDAKKMMAKLYPSVDSDKLK
jgi:hypothetical protein